MMTETFQIALKIMGIGMTGIFIFMLIFWLIVVLLQKIFPGEDIQQ